MAQTSLFSQDTHNRKRLRPASFLRLGICAALFALLLAAGPSAVIAQSTIYVDADAAGIDDGTSWGDAYTDLQSALTAAVSGDQIWVAASTYKPSEDPFGNESPTDPRDKTFYVRDGISIYGGFAGNETTLSERNIAANTTTLSGDIGTPNNNTDNCYHVVLASGSIGVTIDGFTITGGNASAVGTFISVNGDIDRGNGGGIHTLNGSNTLTNNTLSGNTAVEGGGIYTSGGTNTLTNNTLSGNSASFDSNLVSGDGGGIYTVDGTNTLTNNTLSGNTADSGGGIYTSRGSNILTNNTLSGNIASFFGGGIFTSRGSNILTNNTLSGNSAGLDGGGIRNAQGSNTVTNNIFWDNKKNGANNVAGADIEYSTSTLIFTHCLTQANSSFSSGTGIINNQDPLFVDAAGGDYSLMNTSPAINAGNPSTNMSLFPGGPDNPEDLSGNPRVFAGLDETIDMGAYEFQGNAFGVVVPDDGNIVYVDQNVDTGVDDYSASGNSWDDAVPELRDALAWAQDWDGDADGTLQIWVADGVYLPTGDGSTRTATFQLVNNVEVYGGFAGGGTEVLADRDWAANPAILSGDINQSGDLGGNSLHVVSSSSNTSSTLLDGFTITGGNANGSPFPANNGGGMLVIDGAPTLVNNIFTGSTAGSGGGLSITGSSIVSMENLTFMNNTSDSGAGFSIKTSSTAILSNGIVEGNTARLGGGIVNQGTLTLVNTTISDNNATQSGGGIENSGFDPDLDVQNSIIWNNTVNGDSGTATSNVLHAYYDGGTATYTHTLIGNSGGSGVNWDTNLGDDGGNNIDANPLFNDSDNGDYTLTNISPAINAGDPATDLLLFPGGPDNPEDLAGNPRVFNGLPDPDVIDMGAYEFQGEPFSIGPDGNNVLFVDKNVNDGDGSGNSWDNAIPELRDALAWAQDWDGDADGTLQIWVADGVYLPTGDGSTRTATFQLVNNVEIYGGFAGTETALAERDWEANQTILSGDINGSGNLAGNAYSVVTGSVTDATAVIDGFTITVGNADDNTGDPFTPNRHGGGMYNSGGSPTVTNSTFSENSAVNFGGGMFNSGSSPTLTNVTFSGNSAGTFGGGMHNRDNSSPMVSNSTFIGNSALLGGGMLNFISTPTVTNTTFSGNSATERGGGMYNGASSPLVTNCTITENTASIDSGGIYNEASSPVFTNCIIWGNSNGEILGNAAAAPTVSYSIVQGGYTGTGNVNSDPLFVDAAGGDYRLTEFSPAINAGSNAPFEPGGAAEGITTDLGGNDRIFGDTVDMGAYEFGAEPGVVPGGEDRRVLVSNAVASYTLTGSDLSVDGTVSAVRIEQLVGGGTLQLDGTPVTGADLPLTIDAGDITSEKLIWSPDADNYGYGYASITFLLVNEFDVESTDEANLYIDLAAASVEFTDAAGAGWRFITSPATGETIGSLLDPLWTQGFPGSNSPGAFFANVQKLDQENYQWDPNVNATDEFTRGLGLIVYAYEDVDGVGGGFPLTLNSGQQWTSLSDEFDFSAMFLSGGGDVGPTFYLFANPHPIALDFCEFASSDIAVSASFWDSAANGGNGDYINRSCAVDPDETVPIAPFQAFWVLTTGLNPSLSIPEAAYLETTTDGYFKEVESGLVASAATTPNELESSAQTGASETYLFSLNVTSRDGVFTNTAHLLFGRDATPELDKWDAPKISPEGLAPKWLSFYSLDEDGRNYAIQSLPHLFEDQTRIPMKIETTQAGTFTMDWTLPEAHQVSAEYYLRDNENGEVIELTDGKTYSFEISENVVEKRPDRFPFFTGSPVVKALGGTEEKPVRSEPRFELLITTDGSDGFAGLGDLPEAFTLNQNYPNPFNPTTVISYELPQSAQVRLQVYDMAGRQVATLVSGQVAAGRHSINFDASQLSSGVYLYRLQAGSSVLTRKLTILK